MLFLQGIRIACRLLSSPFSARLWWSRLSLCLRGHPRESRPQPFLRKQHPVAVGSCDFSRTKEMFDLFVRVFGSPGMWEKGVACRGSQVNVEAQLRRRDVAAWIRALCL